MSKLTIDIYAVTDQKVYDDEGQVQLIQVMYDRLQTLFDKSFLKNKVTIRLIDVTKDAYDESLVEDNLQNGYLLPWTYFNGELEFYNGLSESMVYDAARSLMSYKLNKKV